MTALLKGSLQTVGSARRQVAKRDTAKNIYIVVSYLWCAASVSELLAIETAGARVFKEFGQE